MEASQDLFKSLELPGPVRWQATAVSVLSERATTVADLAETGANSEVLATFLRAARKP